MKKSKKSFTLLLGLVAAVLGIIALLLPLATAYTNKVSLPVVGEVVAVVSSAYCFIFGAAAKSTTKASSSQTTTDVKLYRPAAPCWLDFDCFGFGCRRRGDLHGLCQKEIWEICLLRSGITIHCWRCPPFLRERTALPRFCFRSFEPEQGCH